MSPSFWRVGGFRAQKPPPPHRPGTKKIPKKRGGHFNDGDVFDALNFNFFYFFYLGHFHDGDVFEYPEHRQFDACSDPLHPLQGRRRRHRGV